MGSRASFRAVVTVFTVALSVPGPAGAQDDYARERRAMVATIARLAESTGPETGRSRIDPKVLEAMGRVPRHRFVPRGSEASAYDNRPLAIGHGQTISQPYIVALMTDLLEPRAGHSVLEIGTGSGYQAAVLAELVGSVATIEIVEPLGREATGRLRALGYANVTVKVGDGYHGWEDRAPFDAIVVTAAASHVPPPLVKQLKSGGRMVIPVGTPFSVQHLMLVEKRPDGSVSTRQILPVRFVPLTGGH